MARDRIEALQALLAEAEAAHGVYEAAELGGVYDDAWPRWYAEYAVDHGIGELLGRGITADELAGLLTRWWADAQGSPASSEPWAASTARRLAAEPPTGSIEP